MPSTTHWRSFVVTTLIVLGIGLKAEACDKVDLALALTPAPLQVAAILNRYFKLTESDPTSADIVILGDSIAQGIDAGAISNKTGKTVLNLAISSSKTQNVLYQIPHIKLLNNPEILVLLVGTNNLYSGEKPCGVIAGIQAIIYEFRARWNVKRVIFIGVLPRGINFQERQDERLFLNNEILKNTDIETVDIMDFSTCIGVVECPLYRNDRIHLTSIGQKILEDKLSKAINR